MRYNEYAIELRIAGMEGSMKFAEKIRILRIQQGKTQQAVADGIHVSLRPYVS